MYIVRWLMGHPIIAAWFLAIIAILLNVGNKNETDTDSAHNDDTEIVETVATSEAPSAATTVATVSDTAATSTATNEEVESKDEVIEKADSSAITEPDSSDVIEESVTESVPVSPEVESKSVKSAENTAEANSGAVVTTTTVDSINATSRSYPDGLTSSAEKANKETETVTQEIITSEVTTSTGNNAVVPKSKTAEAEEKGSDATISDLGEISNEEMLLMAREAYWNNGLEEAAQIYKQLIKIEPKVIEHRGELGNVYWRQGYPKKAAELYSEIALPMIEQGNSERVANMVGFIGLFYPDRATEIHKRLQSTETKSQ